MTPGFLTGMGQTWLLLACAAVLPLLLFGGWAGYLSAEQARAETSRTAIATANAAAARISAELGAQLDLVRALAASSALDQMDLVAFRVTTGRVRAEQRLWHTVELALPSGMQVMNLLRPAGAALGHTADEATLNQVVREQRAVVGGIGPVGPVSGRRLVTLQVPVIRHGTVQAVLSVGMAPDSIDTLLSTAGAPAAWIGVVVDAAGRIVARTEAGIERQGNLASDLLRAAIAQAPDGMQGGLTLEGVRVETVRRTLAGSDGWVVAYGIPLHLLQAPVQRALVLLMAEGAAGLLLAALLTSLVTRDLAQHRADAADRAARFLHASEESRALAVEAAELGVWRWDAETDTFDGSARCLALLDLPPRGTGRPRWAEAFAKVHECDRKAFDLAVRHSIGAGERLEEELRLQPMPGPPRWIRLIGSPAAAGLQGVLADISDQKRLEAERLDLLRGMADVQEQERRRIARDLHDQVGQTVTGLSLGLKTLQDKLAGPGSDPALRDRLAWLRTLAAGIGQEIHRVAADLRPAALDDFGLVPAINALARGWGEQHGIEADVQVVGPVERLPADIETVIYRLVQEALTNVAKHAHATSVSVLLERRRASLRLIVEDDGAGFDTSAEPTDGRQRLGLSGMRERLRLVGGNLFVESAPGAGTTLFITAPDPLSHPGHAA